MDFRRAIVGGGMRRPSVIPSNHATRSRWSVWHQVGRPLYLPQELMGFAEGTGLLWLAGMANGVRFFAPPYWKIEQAAKRAARNPYYEA
jgi:hypothetical protein